MHTAHKITATVRTVAKALSNGYSNEEALMILAAVICKMADGDPKIVAAACDFLKRHAVDNLAEYAPRKEH